MVLRRLIYTINKEKAGLCKQVIAKLSSALSTLNNAEIREIRQCSA